MSFQDKSIQCSDCGTTFTSRAAEQEPFASQGCTNGPKRCLQCRQASKSECYENNSHGSRLRMSPAVSPDCGRDNEVPSVALDDNTVLRRQLKGIERYFLRCPNANLIVVAQIRGFISSHQLEAVLHKLRRKHPLLGVRISLDHRNIAWLTSEGVPENLVHVEQRAAEDSDAWIHRVNEEQKFCFPLDKGPLIRFVLFNYPQNSHLIINCHHSICDGLSITYLIHDILSHTGNPGGRLESTVASVVTENTKLPASASISLFQKIRMKVLNRLWERKNISFSEDDYGALHHKYWSRLKDNSILSWGLTESQTSDFVSRCRKENVTVNSAIVTAFMAAQRNIQGTRPSYLSTVSMPVDIRNRFSPHIGEVFGLYVSSVKATFNYSMKTSFWSNVRKIHKRINKKLTDKSVFMLPQQTRYMHSTLIDSIYFIKYGLLRNKIASFFLRFSGVNKLNTGLEISNIGKYKFPVDYGSLKLEAIFVPVFLSDYQEKCLRVISVGRKMFFTLTFWDSIIDKITAEKIRDMSMTYLSRATGWVC